MLHSSPTNKVTPILEATELEALLEYLNRVHHIDLTGYKRPSLMRRTQLRMQHVGISHYQNYLDYLQQQPDEVKHLLDAIFINHTYFFRDRSVWDYLANQIIPQILKDKGSNEPIQVWSAGCASGEETYSLAILLIEALGVEQFQQRVQIHGTDIDPDALLQARQGCYGADAMKLVPPTLHQYFERIEDSYYWRQDLRHAIQFHLHNLLQDPPLPDIDLLVCRNLFIYFTLEAQLQASVNLYFSLQKTGFLLLGKAENLMTRFQKSIFRAADLQAKVFTKVPNAH